MKKIITMLLPVLAIAGTAYADDGPLKSEMQALLVTVDADGSETLKVKDEVVPGDVLEYKLSYENTGEKALNGLIVSVPVPHDTTYIGMSAKTETPGIFEVSVDDGLTWQAPPVYKETIDGKELVAESEYDFVRWQPDVAINSGETWGFQYRVKVE